MNVATSFSFEQLESGSFFGRHGSGWKGRKPTGAEAEAFLQPGDLHFQGSHSAENLAFRPSDRRDEDLNQKL